MHVVVQQVAEDRHRARRGRRVVVGAEQRGQAPVTVEGGPGPREGVGVDDDVSVDEQRTVSSQPST